MGLLFNGIIGLILITLFEYEIIPTTKFSFVCDDPKISHPSTGDTISERQLLIVTFLAPLLISFFIEFVREVSFSKIKRTNVLTLYKKCVIGIVYVLLTTELLKSAVNEARPHFLDSCKPECTAGDVVSEYRCTNAERFREKDLTRSFPSGHTSLSTFVAIFCSFLVFKRVPSESKRSLTWKVFLLTLCLGWGLLCASTRITDKRHHWWDVLAGASIGSSIAIYNLYLLPREETEEKKKK